MKFVSYAQNFEDVVLHRALGHIWNGTYVDVGAFDPTRDSVTKAFYDRGWSGINIDPVEAFHRRFVEERPRDRNIWAAISDAAGTLPYYVVGETGLSTLDPQIADGHRQVGHEIRETSVPVLALDEVVEELSDRSIHFLKIDVEGHEAKVLAGLDLRKVRPWVLVIEATVPSQTTASHQTWESRVIEAGYRFAYFDGLSRYYVADEHSDLAAVLAVPPNVFDEFETLHTVELKNSLKAAEESYAELSKLLDQERNAAKAHSEELLGKLLEEREKAAELAAHTRELADLALTEAREAGERTLAEAREAGNLALKQVQDAATRTGLETQADRDRLHHAHQAVLSQLTEIHRSKAWHLIVAYRRLFNLVRRLVRRRRADPVPVPVPLDPPASLTPPKLILREDASYVQAELARRIALNSLFRRS